MYKIPAKASNSDSVWWRFPAKESTSSTVSGTLDFDEVKGSASRSIGGMCVEWICIHTNKPRKEPAPVLAPEVVGRHGDEDDHGGCGGQRAQRVEEMQRLPPGKGEFNKFV